MKPASGSRSCSSIPQWTSISCSKSCNSIRALTIYDAIGQALDQRRLGVVFVLNLTDDLLEDVLDRHETRRAAVFIYDDRDVDAPGLQLAQEFRAAPCPPERRSAGRMTATIGAFAFARPTKRKRSFA